MELLTENRQVIFVGGTSRSGSTLLNLILGNDPNGIGLGEIQAAIRPVKRHHHELRKSVVEAKSPWSEVIMKNHSQVYATVFDAYPNTDFLVDSSKHVMWIRNQNANCAKQGIQSKNVLIYKSPYELANSYKKRNIQWERPFVDYHRKYVSLIDEFFVISYKDLVTDPLAMQNLCNHLGISFSSDKMKYWLSTGNVFFGSKTPTGKRAIEYDQPTDRELIQAVDVAIRHNPLIQEVWTFLEKHKNQVVRRSEAVNSSLVYPRFRIVALTMKYWVDGWYGYLFPRK
jgi:hypothetical protein